MGFSLDQQQSLELWAWPNESAGDLNPIVQILFNFFYDITEINVFYFFSNLLPRIGLQDHLRSPPIY
jgi:hypothetical protein